ncbi:MAG: hypothetical protein V8R64_02270 [Thomasclavelia sp.]
MEFVYKYTKDNDPDYECYHNLSLSGEIFGKWRYDPKLVYLLFNAFILEITGSGLEVEQCSTLSI